MRRPSARLGSLAHFFPRPRVGDDAFLEQHRAVGEPVRERHLVGREQHGLPRSLAVVQQPVQQRSATAGPARRRARRAPAPRRADQRAGELGLLAHAARELARQEVRARIQTQPPAARDARTDLVVDGAVGERHQLEVLPDREVVVEQRRVGHERQRRPRALGLGLTVRVVPETRTVPPLGSSSPAIARTAVDLPLPLAPIRATHSPAATVRSDWPARPVAHIRGAGRPPRAGPRQSSWRVATRARTA